MNSNQEECFVYKPDKPGTIAFNYLFNYFGGDTFKDETITGAGVQLAIHVYKDGEEQKFTEEPKIHDTYLCDVFKVSFSRENIYKVTKNVPRENLFRLEFGWDEMKAEVVGYYLDYESEFSEELLKDMPESMKGLPVSSVMEVTEDEFKEFVSGHLDDFDITDNINAQVPSVSFV